MLGDLGVAGTQGAELEEAEARIISEETKGGEGRGGGGGSYCVCVSGMRICVTVSEGVYVCVQVGGVSV